MEIKTSEFDGVKLTEYKGKFSIEALKPNEDKFFPVWAKYQKGRDEFQEKSWPVKVVLGDKETAIKVLKMLLDEIAPGTINKTNDDVPF